MTKKSALPSIPAHPLPAPIPPGFIQLTSSDTNGTWPVLLPARSLVVVGPSNDKERVRIFLVGGGAAFEVCESYAEVLRLIAATIAVGA